MNDQERSNYQEQVKSILDRVLKRCRSGELLLGHEEGSNESKRLQEIRNRFNEVLGAYSLARDLGLDIDPYVSTIREILTAIGGGTEFTLRDALRDAKIALALKREPQFSSQFADIFRLEDGE